MGQSFRGWVVVKDVLLPQEQAELDTDMDRFVIGMIPLHGELLETIRVERDLTQSVSRRTRSRTPSRKREVLKDIVKENGLIRPVSSIPTPLYSNLFVKLPQFLTKKEGDGGGTRKTVQMFSKSGNAKFHSSCRCELPP